MRQIKSFPVYFMSRSPLFCFQCTNPGDCQSLIDPAGSPHWDNQEFRASIKGTMLSLPSEAFKWVYNADSWYLNDYSSFKRPPMSLFGKEAANRRDRLIQIHNNKQDNKAALSNLINTESTSPSVKQRSSSKEQSERQPTRTSASNANKISKRKDPLHLKRNTVKKPENVQEESDSTTPKPEEKKSKKNTQKQTNTRVQTPIGRTDAKENTKILDLETRTSEHEPVSKKSKIQISSCFVSIGDLNVITTETYLSDYRPKFHDTSNPGQSTKNHSQQSKAPPVIRRPRKHRSHSLSYASLQPRYRPRLKAKSLTHLPDIETLRGFKIDDCVARLKKSIPLQNIPAKNHLKVDEPPKKRRRVRSVDSSDKECGPSKPKQAKPDSTKNQTCEQSNIKGPNSPRHKAVRPSTRKELLLFLFGEDSETEDGSTCSDAGTTPSKKASEFTRGSVKNALVKGKKPRSQEAKPTKPVEARLKSKANKHSRRSQKPSTHQSPMLKWPQQGCTKEMEPSLIRPNPPPFHQGTIKSPVASCTSKPKPASKSDIKLTSPKVVAKPCPEPLMAKQEEDLTKFESCLALSLPAPPANQTAKIAHEEDLCTCTINSVSVQALLKNEVVVKEEKSSGSALHTEPLHNDGANVEGLAVKSERFDLYNSCVRVSLENFQKCLVSFQTARALPPLAWPAKEQVKSSVEEQRCTERCHVSSVATVKNDSRVVESSKSSYSCAESTNEEDEVQIVSVTVPAISTKKTESAPNFLPICVDLKSLGVAEITCPAPNSEHSLGSEPSNVPELQRCVDNYNNSICTATTATAPQSRSIELSLSFRDRNTIKEILFNHIYFLIHIFNAQRAYLSCLQNLRHCQRYFAWEFRLFENETKKRIRSQSMQMCKELLELHITCSISLPATAEEIVKNLTKKLNAVDTPQRLTKPMVHLCIWTLMSEHSELYATVPLFKLILSHSDVGRKQCGTTYSEPFPLQMRQLLMEQIQQYNELVRTTTRMVTQQSASSSILSLCLLSRPTANPPQRPAPAIERMVQVHRYKPPRHANSAVAERATATRASGAPSLPPRVTLATSQSPNRSTALPRVDNFVFPINENFRIRLPYSRPFVLTAALGPVMSTAPSRVATLQDTTGNPDKPVKRPVVQGIAALHNIGRAEDMLAFQKTEQQLVDTPSRRSKLVSRQQEKPASSIISSPLACGVGPPPEEEQRQPAQEAGSEENTRQPSNADVETIDLTWLDDMNEEELKDELDYAFVKTELDGSCEQMAPKEGEEEVTYTYVYDTNLCICDEPPKYSCHCAQAWYCGKACQILFKR
ncbi:uncharacterized protein LOC109536707 isoform X3 [Dendroctonus ponderosae]|uniref:uncharacterized protein LOC109536707 isoform X3 n=1 Tax=Dendroctonus ponderosae TaxID=77166 RepID=UPI002035500B|nr:uncharacterized protein LOC109536707 isoform X3 [Dendroctonus ponderosae]